MNRCERCGDRLDNGVLGELIADLWSCDACARAYRKREAAPHARLERTLIEVGTGKGYRWAAGVYIIKPDGSKLYPPVSVTEARRICKREGWPLGK